MIIDHTIQGQKEHNEVERVSKVIYCELLGLIENNELHYALRIIAHRMAKYQVAAEGKK